ncbi:11293_t:CDS:10, partial [Entrophospora sp. SA101]
MNYEEQIGNATKLTQNIINYQRDDVDNLTDRLNFSSALKTEEYIPIDDDEINEEILGSFGQIEEEDVISNVYYYEEQIGNATKLTQNIINYQRDDVDNLTDRLNFSSALKTEEYIPIDDDEINEEILGSFGQIEEEDVILVTVNNPDKIIFVGEALVGNEAVDQLTKFNQALKDFSGLQNPRHIDGIILTKFDTIDDKVGAALSMAYTTGQPILFVGTGQTYTDLKNMKVAHIVQRGSVTIRQDSQSKGSINITNSIYIGSESLQEKIDVKINFSGLQNPRHIDGIILTKFDTIDDKVGAALSMAYTTGQPILFVDYEEQIGNATKLTQNIINYQRDDVDNLTDRLNFSSALKTEEYIPIDDDEINEEILGSFGQIEEEDVI